MFGSFQIKPMRTYPFKQGTVFDMSKPVEKTIFYFCIILTWSTAVFAINPNDRLFDVEIATTIPMQISRDSNHEHLLVYNPDGSVRGGAYSLHPYSQVFVSNLHTLQKSWFFEIYKRDFFFYGFKLPHNRTDEVNKDYRWVDMVIIISRKEHPAGINEPFVRGLLNNLMGRELGLDVISSAAAVESIVPTPGNLSKYMFKSNWGSVRKLPRGTFFQIPQSTSTITPGSSGALVYAKSTDFVGATHSKQEIYTDKIPIGILKCRDLKFPQSEGNDRYELQSFDFLFDFELWINDLKSIPDVVYPADCININGRGHGGA